MHAFSARPKRGKQQLHTFHCLLFKAFFLSPAAMSEASKVAQALNLWARERLDMMGGADGKALDDLLNEFLVEPEVTHPPMIVRAFPVLNIH